MSRRPGSGDTLRLALVVAKGEFRRLLRDKKAILLAVVLPILAYPAFLLASQKLNSLGQRQIEEREVLVARDLGGLPAPLAEAVRARLDARDEGVRFDEREIAGAREVLETKAPDKERLRDWAEDARGEAYAGLLVALAAKDGAPPALHLVFDGAGEDGIALSTQVLGPLRQLADELESEAYAARLGADPAVSFAFQSFDAAPPKDRQGLALGRFLPLIAVLVLLSGGAFAAIDTFAGEREQGTLETLLSQPVPTIALAWGKYLVVLATAIAAWIGNVVSLVLSASLGLFDLPGLGVEGPGTARILLAGLVFLPTVVLISASLCFLAARARSFREAQAYLLPATLVGAALASPAAAADVQLDLLLALVPLAGPSLALRDAFAGNLQWLPAALAFLSSSVYAALALRRIAVTLDAERLLASPSPKGMDAGADTAQRSIRTALVAVAAVYLAGGWLQSLDLVWGLVATLWGLVLGAALWLARANLRGRGTADRALPANAARGVGPITSLKDALQVCTPGGVSRHVALALSAVFAAPALAQAGRHLVELQSRFLPLPGGADLEPIARALESLSLPALVALFAISPGITEELLFRGAVLRGLFARARAGILPPLVFQAAVFAVMHASIHRLAITFSLGLLLGAITYRSGALWTAIALHAAYNACAVLTDRVPTLDLAHPLWWLGTLPLALLLLRPRPALRARP